MEQVRQILNPNKSLFNENLLKVQILNFKLKDSTVNYPFMDKSSKPYTFQPDICR